MRSLSIVLIVLLCLMACTKLPDSAPVKTSQDTQKDDQYRKEIEDIKKTIKGEVKIKLKKDGKGNYYSWEISGKDAGEVLKTNDLLVKKLEKASN